MRVLVLEAQTPFAPRDRAITELVAALHATGHTADVVSIPFRAASPEQLLRHAAAWRLIEVGAFLDDRVDLVIATAFPTYLVQHPLKIAWLLDTHRDAEMRCRAFEGSLHGYTTLIDIDRQSLEECVRAFSASAHLATHGSWAAAAADLVASCAPGVETSAPHASV